jgi:hypothetical protein
MLVQVGQRYQEVFENMTHITAAIHAANAWLTAALQEERAAAVTKVWFDRIRPGQADASLGTELCTHAE